ncbi:MAG: hypothetical protein U1F24_06000 [Alphaproteobacteria bacterium]
MSTIRRRQFRLVAGRQMAEGRAVTAPDQFDQTGFAVFMGGRYPTRRTGSILDGLEVCCAVLGLRDIPAGMAARRRSRGRPARSSST